MWGARWFDVGVALFINLIDLPEEDSILRARIIPTKARQAGI